MEKKKTNVPKPPRTRGLFGRLIMGSRKELSIFEEEQMMSPWKTAMRKFVESKLSMTGVVVLCIMFLIVLIGPYVFPIDLSYAEPSQANLGPGFDLMKYPKQLVTDGVEKIVVGKSYAIGLTKKGEVLTWGKTKISAAIDMANLPKDMKGAKIVDIAVGFDHAFALDEYGKLYGWGSNRTNQLQVPEDLAFGISGKVKQLTAGYQVTAVVMEDGRVYAWGNENMTDIVIREEFQGNIDKVVFTSDALVALMKDGSVKYVGIANNIYSRIPEGLESGVVDIASTYTSVAALKADGTVVIWGNTIRGERNVPATDSKKVKLFGGQYHYLAQLENGELVGWGSDMFKQSTIPGSLKGVAVDTVFNGYYQNYVLKKDGSLTTFGLKGYVFGTDTLGRDVLTRLINGGKMTMTVGAVAVIISTIIGIIVGCVSGYFGGWVDLILQRISEVINSLPFLPFALLLSAIMGSRIDESKRVLLIMVVLGVLSWPGLARLVRAQMLAEREKEFVTAARAVGVKEMGIAFRHILPNVLSVIIVTATLDFATCMLTEASLSYLGFGVTPPTPTWGNMLNGSNNSTIIQQYWWQWVFPSIALGICTICINLIGDGLRDALDPKSNER